MNIPVDWENPQEADFERFSTTLAGAGERRVLVHCQMNMRASMFTFLYRVTHDRRAAGHGACNPAQSLDAQ